jgi:hypothetical protein
MRPRLPLALLLAPLLLCAPALHAAPLTLGQLMGSLAQHPQGSASFTEHKHLAILEQPLESSGTLVFVAPARLEKRTLKPKPETMILDGDRLTLERGSRRQVLALKDYPEVAGMIESIRATLAGDRAALERVYRLALEGDTERWSLTLTPLDARVGALVARITMAGAGNAVNQVEILQADGDRSVMRIEQSPSPRGDAQKAGAP